MKKMGFFSLTLFVVGAQIGPGIFALPQLFAPYGVYGILSWAFVGVGALLLSVVFAQLSLLVPLQTGGPHTYVHAVFKNQWLTFLTAWTYWNVSWIGSISVVMTAVCALESIFGSFNGWTRFLVQSGSFALGFLFNWRGVRDVSWSNTVATLLKALVLLCILLYVLPLMSLANLSVPSLGKGEIFLSAGALGLWGFVGLESATVHVEAIENPTQNIPRAMFLGTACVLLVYLLSTTVLLAAYPPSVLTNDTSPFLLVAQIVFGDKGKLCMCLIMLFVCANALISWMMLTAHSSMGAAQQGLFPAWFSKKNRFGTPVFGFLFPTSVSLIILALTHNASSAALVRSVINTSVNGLLFVYTICVVSWVCLLRTQALPMAWTNRMLAVLTLLFCGSCFWFAGVEAFSALLVFGVTGTCAYRLFCPLQKAKLPLTSPS